MAISCEVSSSQFPVSSSEFLVPLFPHWKLETLYYPFPVKFLQLPFAVTQHTAIDLPVMFAQQRGRTPDAARGLAQPGGRPDKSMFPDDLMIMAQEKVPLPDMRVLIEVFHGIDRRAGDPSGLAPLRDVQFIMLEGELNYMCIYYLHIIKTKGKVAPFFIPQRLGAAHHLHQAGPVIGPDDDDMDMAVLAGIDASGNGAELAAPPAGDLGVGAVVHNAAVAGGEVGLHLMGGNIYILSLTGIKTQEKGCQDIKPGRDRDAVI
jgi:hypothetical protein